MLDRSPDDELGSGDEDDSDSEIDESMETTHDGERTIYPWMKKIHVAGVGMYCTFYADYEWGSLSRFFNPLSLDARNSRHGSCRQLRLLLLGVAAYPKSNPTFFA